MLDHKKQGKEADAMIAALNQMENPSENPSADTDAAIASTPPADITPPSLDATEDSPAPAAAPTEPPADSSVTPPVEDNSSSPDASAEAQKLLDTAEQRWKVAQGMIEKKDTELEQLRTLVATLVEQTKAPADSTTPAEPSPQRLVTDDDIESFGPALHEFIIKVVKDVSGGMIATMKADVVQRVGSVEETISSVETKAAKTDADRFDDDLSRLAPGWEALNKDPGFLLWLDEPDGLSGATRLDTLQQAYVGLDARRTAQFFNVYNKRIAEPASPTPAPAAEPRPTPAAHVTPGRSNVTPSTTTPDSGTVWTGASIAKVYDDHMNGKLSRKEFDKLERDIFKAQRDGRIAA